MTITILLIALAAWGAGYLVGGYRPRPEERFPIASAPRDGTMVKLWFGLDDEPTVGWYLVYVGIDLPPPGVHILPSDFSDFKYRWAFLDQLGNPLRRDLNIAVDGPGGPSHWAPL